MNIGFFGTAFVMGIAAIGSAFGIGIAGQAAIGSWKRCYMNNKAAPFILTVFAGAPLTQTIYGFLLMGRINAAVLANIEAVAAGTEPDKSLLYFALGIFSGLAFAFSAYFQGKAGAAGSDALGETGKGFAQYIMVVGLCETVALFAMAFSFGMC
ncbi:MAG: V-type ATP synthase subunit K [Treponema sp.]|nr:V-type ATP synthase subunit K [Treponema sp.]